MATKDQILYYLQNHYSNQALARHRQIKCSICFLLTSSYSSWSLNRDTVCNISISVSVLALVYVVSCCPRVMHSIQSQRQRRRQLFCFFSSFFAVVTFLLFNLSLSHNKSEQPKHFVCWRQSVLFFFLCATGRQSSKHGIMPIVICLSTPNQPYSHEIA